MFASLIHLVFAWPLMVFAHRLPRGIQKGKFDTIVTFGDSYTDNGSLTSLYQTMFNESTTPSILPKRWSDGYLWIEYLQDLMNISYLHDFARSGATGNNSIVSRETQDLTTQIEAYKKSSLNDKSNPIYFVWIGLNDIHDVFLRHDNMAKSTIDQMGLSVHNNLNKLYKLGATHIVLLNVIPMGELPKFYNLSLNEKSQLDDMVKQYNANLLHGMDKLNEGGNSSELQILHYDTYTKFSGFRKHWKGSPESCNRGAQCKK
ncbi:unnamed protein product [Rhizopus stolonifer]